MLNSILVRSGLLLCGSLLFSAAMAKGETVHLQLRWHHQFQFAGYYAALEKGFYQAAGLDVVIDAGAPDKMPVQQVIQQHAHYGVANSELLLARLRGAPVVALAAIYQHSPSVLLARKDAGVLSPHDLVGKKVMLMDQDVDADFFAMFYNEGIKMSDIDVIPSSFNIKDLVDGKVDAFNSYLSNEPFYLEQHGVDFAVLNPRNYGVDFYSDILFTTEEEVINHPVRVKAFRAASLEGWRYAMDHPGEIIELLMAHYPVDKSRAHLEFEANAIRALILPDLIELGHMNPWRWQQMASTFVQAGMIANDNALEGFVYDPEFKLDKSELWIYTQIFGVIILTIIFILAILGFAYRTAKREIRLRLEAEAAIRQIAYRDALTDLDNRHHLFVLAEQILRIAKRENYKVAVCFVDLNDFKSINDRFGHKAGDEVLRQVGKKLRNFIRQSDVAARFGGDEFVLLLNHIHSRDDVDLSLLQIQEAIAQPISFQDEPLSVSASVGLAIYPDDGSDIDALIDFADQDMYRIKGCYKKAPA